MENIDNIKTNGWINIITDDMFHKWLNITIENLKNTINKLLKLPQNCDLDLKNFSKFIDNWIFDKQILLIWWSQISWSLSPFIHTYSWFLAWKNNLYTLMDISNEPEWTLKLLLSEIEKNSSILWANITMPYKINAYEILNNLWQLDDSAMLVWAVNTISKNNWKIVWFNTDMDWIIGPIKNTLLEKCSEIKHAYIFWAGWASKASIAWLLKMWVSNIHIFNRTTDHLINILNHFNSEKVRDILIKFNVDNFAIQLHEYDVWMEEYFDISNIITNKWIVINTLPFGFKDNYSKYPIRKEVLDKVIWNIILYFDVVYDMNYSETPMTSIVKDYWNIFTCDWRDMLVWQAKKWFELWTWIEFNSEIILKIIQ